MRCSEAASKLKAHCERLYCLSVSVFRPQGQRSKEEKEEEKALKEEVLKEEKSQEGIKKRKTSWIKAKGQEAENNS